MRQLTGSKYIIVACSCILVALQSTSGRAAPPGTVSPYYQPGTPPGNPQTSGRPDYPQPYYYNPQGRSAGYLHPDRYANPRYDHPDYGQPDYTQAGYPPAYGSSAPVTQQDTGDMTNQPTDPAAVAAATATPAPAAAPESATAPGLQTTVAGTPADPTLTMPAPAAGTAAPEGLVEQTIEKAEGMMKAEDTAAIPAVPAPAAALESTTVPAAATATPEQPAQRMPTPLATPAAPADPTLTMPAPAAGTAAPGSVMDKTTGKVEEILKTGEAAVPETE